MYRWGSFLMSQTLSEELVACQVPATCSDDIIPTPAEESGLGTIPILRQQKDWVGGFRKRHFLLTFSTVFTLVTQPMLQLRPNCTELRSMDYYHQIFCRF